MTTTSKDIITEIANDLVAHCKIEADDIVEHDCKIWDKHFAEGWTSIEGDGQVYTGREEQIAKYRQWEAGVIVHGCEVIGPFIGVDGFSVIFELDMEGKDGAFPRSQMTEVANYTVENGKIVKEEFRYPPMECSGECGCEK